MYRFIPETRLYVCLLTVLPFDAIRKPFKNRKLSRNYFLAVKSLTFHCFPFFSLWKLPHNRLNRFHCGIHHFFWNEGIRALMAAQDQPHENLIFPEEVLPRGKSLSRVRPDRKALPKKLHVYHCHWHYKTVQRFFFSFSSCPFTVLAIVAQKKLPLPSNLHFSCFSCQIKPITSFRINFRTLSPIQIFKSSPKLKNPKSKP